MARFVYPSSADGYLGYFDPSAIVNAEVVNTKGQGFVWTCVFSSLWCIPRKGIAGSCGHPRFKFIVHWVSSDELRGATCPGGLSFPEYVTGSSHKSVRVATTILFPQVTTSWPGVVNEIA